MVDINYRTILKVIGILLLLEAAFMLLPLCTSFIYHEHDYKAFLISIACCIGVGGICFLQSPRSERKPLGKREGLLIVALSWVFFSIFGMLPYLFSGSIEKVSDAFFETMSGVTGTGATVIEDVEILPHGILLWRSLTQWLGGLGIILFTLALLPLLNGTSGGGMQLFAAESTGIMYDKLGPRIGQTAKRLWTTYIGITTVLIVLLIIGPMNTFDAICHALTTASTGGFSTKNDSIAYWDSAYTEYVIIIFMFISAINYALVYRATRGQIKKMFTNEEVKWYMIIIGVCTALIVIGSLFLDVHPSIEKTIRTSLFQVVSIITSTGFIVVDYVALGSFFCIIICLLMFSGGCASSTSGGAKVIRIVVLLKNTVNEFYRQVHPNAIVPVRVNQQVISHEIVSKILAYLFIYAILAIVSALILSTMGLNLEEAFGCTISCLGNNGPGLGGYLYTFKEIPEAGKWLLSFIMLVGRLEIFTVLILFTSYFWKK